MPSSRSRAAAGIPSRGAEKCSLTLEHQDNRQDLRSDVMTVKLKVHLPDECTVSSASVTGNPADGSPEG